MKMQSPFKKSLPTFLIINILVLSSLPASTNYSTKSTAKCQATIAEAKKTISKGRRIKVNIKSFNVAQQYKTYPPEYSIGYTIRLSGLATESVMKSSQFMKIISQKVINNCNYVGLVDFIQDQSDWVIRFGSINDEVKKFECVEPTLDNLDWGVYSCA